MSQSLMSSRFGLGQRETADYDIPSSDVRPRVIFLAPWHALDGTLTNDANILLFIIDGQHGYICHYTYVLCPHYNTVVISKNLPCFV